MDTVSGHSQTKPSFVRAGSVEELRKRGCVTVSSGRHGIVVFWHEGTPYAVDNRCPHMGFPLSRGTIRDGVLTCHWHHARFDLQSGGTFDPFADDVPAYRVEVRHGEIWVETTADARNLKTRWLARLQDGQEQNLSLVTAKSILALRGLNVPSSEVLLIGSLHGSRFRRDGWGQGLTIMTALANTLSDLSPDHQSLALYHGLVQVARDTAGQHPRFNLKPLPELKAPLPRLAQWYREFIDVRHSNGAERCLRSALALNASPSQVAGLMGTAVTDHPFINGGHTLDFTNKAFEILDQIGWRHAETILPSLVSQTASASRNEESSAWRHPVDLIEVLQSAEDQLSINLSSNGMPSRWNGFDATVEAVLADDPASGTQSMLAAFEQGASPLEVSQALCYAAALRVARFHTSNEFGDWISVLHTFTYCNALDHLLRRAQTHDVARGLLAGAIAVYLDRFLNMPSQRLPEERSVRNEPADADALIDRLLDLTNRQHEVEAAASCVYRYLSLGHDDRRIIQTLGYVLLREDADFHTYQMFEAGVRQYHLLRAGRPEEARHVLVAVARYLAAHSPTDRAMNQTYTIAARLYRGDELYTAPEQE